jgi:pyruvate dehydrogenase E2 component (dihydrolipoamide acetyltransferase)
MELRIPELGDNVAVATVVGVLVREGDRVAPGQPLLELETDKAVMEVPAEAGGVVKRVWSKWGDEVRPRTALPGACGGGGSGGFPGCPTRARGQARARPRGQARTDSPA